MQTRHSVLGYKVDLYFHDYKLAKVIDENGHINRNKNHKIKRQKEIEGEIGCEFIRIDPDNKKFSCF